MARSARYRLIDLSTGEAAAFSVGDAGVERLAEADARAPLVALAPADRCSVVRVDVPEMSPGRLVRALRWAIEDAIAGDPEQQHVVPVRRERDGRLTCLVAARADMQRWIENAGERPLYLLPDAACVPRADHELVLMARGDRILARGADEAFDRFEPELLDVIVPELMDACGDDPQLVWIGDPPPGSPEFGEPELRPTAGRALDELAKVALDVDARALNLMRGEYAPRESTASPRQWRLAAALAGAVLVLLLAGALGEYWVVERERARLAEQVESRFAEIFPSITTLVRPRAQAERALADLRGGGGDRFVSLLGSVSPLFSGAEGVEIVSLRYLEGRVEVELETPGLADLEALERQIAARGLETGLGNVEVRTDRASGVLNIGGAIR